jgi:hypothetical protein
MPLNARAKGQRGEREVVALLQPVVTKVYHAAGLPAPELERNLMQSRKGGYDIVGLDWFALEVKRHENLGLSGIREWWEQCTRQAAEGQEAVLFYRPNRLHWLIKMYGYLCVGPNGGYRVRSPVTVDLPTFLMWFELRLTRDLVSRGVTL